MTAGREVVAVDGPGLSAWERRVLAEIEDDLRLDTRLDRRLSRMEHAHAWARRPARWLDAALRGRVPSGVLTVLLSLSAGLLLVTCTVHGPVVLGVFAVVWLPTLVLGTVRFASWRRHRSGR
ncbi:hypothetical protein CFP65_7043 [Kitasatospora sp. MMS16-BH015]|uniref:hypothetical protein n=1 Tax=Kitasatospora sp. MMS16-BH015 TaxID=2018025 RepID=UPI000CA183D6|nr:hypothetical protein [Kitasatospora sp. MMS16-BH015]AUG81649.1 hypothetical protein CFP65_7043 [Kitasatospora sp. MMS16-BH015]